MDNALPKAQGQRIAWVGRYGRALKAGDYATAADLAGRRLSGRAEITADSFERAADGGLEFEYEGGTEIFYDDQDTATRGGLPLFLDEGGESWTAAEITVKGERKRKAQGSQPEPKKGLVAVFASAPYAYGVRRDYRLVLLYRTPLGLVGIEAIEPSPMGVRTSYSRKAEAVAAAKAHAKATGRKVASEVYEERPRERQQIATCELRPVGTWDKPTVPIITGPEGKPILNPAATMTAAPTVPA